MATIGHALGDQGVVVSSSDTEYIPFHKCKYYIVRKSMKFIATSKTYTEKCLECERTKEVDYKFIVEGSKFPKKTVRWYDEYGNLDQITGDK